MGEGIGDRKACRERCGRRGGMERSKCQEAEGAAASREADMALTLTMAAMSVSSLQFSADDRGS